MSGKKRGLLVTLHEDRGALTVQIRMRNRKGATVAAVRECVPRILIALLYSDKNIEFLPANDYKYPERA
jgi:hypothetical protein